MKNTLLRTQPLLLAATAFCLHAAQARADDATPPAAPSPDDSGFTILSNATNVTHWGLGVGAGVEQSPYAGDGAKYTPIPLFYFDNKWVHALGTTLDLKIGKWDGVAVSLRGKYALGDGYNGSDARILNGMQNRHGAFWFGPAFAWETGFGTLSGDVLTGGNKGQQAHLSFGKSFGFGRLSVEPHVGAEWLSHKYVDYYYGVRPSEATAIRPAYTGTSAVNVELGARVDYRFTAHQSATLDVGVKHLGSGITDSPIVGRKFVPEVRVGYLYRFN
ncbi:MipA/OmpV family protein [Paraburkholderia sp.]|uniref:MipA/OmpV family protein n=1 Tax=Paraburkholderia sp. TaxID=1926495 RepID=UPI003D6ECFC7